MKILPIVLSMTVTMSACSSRQARQDQLDYDRMRLEIYQANTAAKNAIAARESDAMTSAIKEICLRDSNPGLCLAVTVNKSQSTTPAQVEQIPQRTLPQPSMAGKIFLGITAKVLDVGLAGYGVNQSNKTSRYNTDSNNRLILGLVDSVARNAGTHLGDGSQFVAGNYAQDNSIDIDESVTVGGDQSIAGRDVISGHVGDTIGGDQVGEDQFTAGSDIAIGTANFNTGRIDADGPFVECSSGDSGNSGNGGPAGNGGTGVGSTGGLGAGTGGTGGTGLLTCDGE